MEYRCLRCKNRWVYEGATEPRQCGKCRGYDIIAEKDYQAIIQDVRSVVDTNPRIRLEVLRAVIRNRGLRFKPLSTLNLVEAVLDDVFPQLPAGESISSDERFFFEKRRVTRKEGETSGDEQAAEAKRG